MRLQAATPHRVAAVEALQLGGMQGTRTRTQAAPREAHQAVMRCTQLAAAEVHLGVALGM